MKLPPFLTTPLPPCVLSLADDQIVLALLSRRRDALTRVEAAPLEGVCFQHGPVGLLHVERGLLSTSLATVAGRMGKLPPRASVLVPTSWVRCVQVDVGGLPRQRQEAEDVVRWRLKKLLPCRPEEVRLDFLPGGDGRVVVALALDRPLAAIEEVLEAAGTRVGRIEPTAVAVSNLVPSSGGSYLVVVTEPRSLGFVAVSGGAIRLLRQKGLPGEASRAAEFVAREVDQSLALLGSGPEGGQAVEVWVVAFDEELAFEVEACVAGRAGVGVRRLVVGGDRVPAGTELPGALLGTLLACGAGREA